MYVYVLVRPHVCLKDTDKTVHLPVVESLISNMAKSTFFLSNPKQINREYLGVYNPEVGRPEQAVTTTRWTASLDWRVWV